jgi:putative molybdopterin biosynthesis protein
VQVSPLGLTGAHARLAPADLTIVGSHCVGVELLIDLLHAEGLTTRFIAQGSQGGLFAAERGLCDIAPIHLQNPDHTTYNTSFVPPSCTLTRGYRRLQGLVTRQDDPRFTRLRERHTGDPDARLRALPSQLVRDDDVIMVNRNRGSGTRQLIDALLAPLMTSAPGHRAAPPRGYHHEARSHQGVVACVAQGRADWGVAIEPAARDAALSFVPIRDERYDFVLPASRQTRPPVQRFLALLTHPEVRATLTRRGFCPD